TGFEGGPLDTFSWVTPPCSGTFCTLVMDRSRSLDAEVSEIDYSVDLVALAGPDQRVPLGTPLTLEGYVYSPFGRPLPPLSYAWWDDTTGEYLGYTATITPTLGFGLHDLTFYASDDSGGSAWDQVRVLVHDPQQATASLQEIGRSLPSRSPATTGPRGCGASRSSEARLPVHPVVDQRKDVVPLLELAQDRLLQEAVRGEHPVQVVEARDVITRLLLRVLDRGVRLHDEGPVRGLGQ